MSGANGARLKEICKAPCPIFALLGCTASLRKTLESHGDALHVCVALKAAAAGSLQLEIVNLSLDKLGPQECEVAVPGVHGYIHQPFMVEMSD